MKKLAMSLAGLLAMTSMPTTSVMACTDFRITAKDGTVIVTRSMEFGMDFKSNLRTSNRGRLYSNTINGKQSMSWRAKYGYVFVDGLDQDVAIDGMNEAGLSFEALLFPGEAQYQTVPPGEESHGIPYLQFGDWVLSNFKTVDEVRNALLSVFVYTQTLPALGNTIFPLHFSVQDMSGKGIVIEYVKDKMNIYDNEIGMLTNSPSYNWQMTNLRNYLNLTPYNPKPISMDGLVFSATGQGAGMIGLPGDVSPPSRFVKVAFMTKSVYPVTNASTALNLAQHIINNVDIPNGLVRSVINGKESADLTQWVVFKDLTHKMFYYRTYNDMTMHSVEIDKLSFSETQPRYKMSLATLPFIMDETNRLVNGNKY